MYRLDPDDSRFGRPWVLSAVFGGQRMWVADFETFAQAMAWVRKRELTYGIDMGIGPILKYRRAAK